MSDSPYEVGYGRPPQHTRFQKGQSGNPGGRPSPEPLLKQHFDIALSVALKTDEEALRNAKPAMVIEAFARKIALRALDGRPSAERHVLSILERMARESAPTVQDPKALQRSLLIEPEECREILGDQYEEFQTRFNKAVKAGSVDDLLALADDFQNVAEFPETGNS
jgi:hypothetical protein